MARNKYIDAERLRERYKRFSWSACMWVNDVDICDCISSEDIRPVEYGRWIPVEDTDCWRGYTCSNCGKAVNKRENYCPECGSLMGN